MRFHFSILASLFVVTLFALIIVPSRAVAQEGEIQVVDEVIAQVNDDVITLSMLKREMKERVEALKQNGMSEQQATDEVSKHQPELIATLVNEQLLLQKGKELELSSDVEAEVNRRLLEVAKEQGIPTIAKLEEAMLQSGMKLADVRATMRAEMMKQAVFQQEVDRKVYLGLSTDEVKKYYEAHQDKFRKPEAVDVSEIFLNLSGKNEADVKARAQELVTQIRAGADFGALAAANSEREKNGVRTAPQDKGEVGMFEVPSLREDIAAAVKNVKEGGVTDPLKGPDGYQILKVNKRTAAAATSSFNDNQVREAITMERQPKEREAYLQNLRNEGFIKIAESYRATVEPLLKLSTTSAAKTEGNEKEKKSKP
ncbi:MAG: peptidyl-prolyl cis-trans isomerase [Pyrinomonadaceae bacterium]